jgi:serine/threonine protein kinase
MVAPGAEHDDSRRLVEANARVGTTLRGKWKLDSLLGFGGMAAVYAATHRNGMRGAVKLLDPVVGRSEQMRERFLREGYLANSVNHTAAVLVLDDDTTDDGHVYLVMELLDGRTLEELAAAGGGKLPVREVLDAMAQLLDALAHAHARGIIHRDIKPDNLFITDAGTLKVLDFGIARLLESEMALSTTQTGSPMGTPAFMSPEQARGRTKTVDAQSDIYSVGATMFTLLSGELVHGSDITISEYVAAAFTNQARPLASVAPDVPAPIAAVVDRALRLEKSERWPSAAEMGAALRAAYTASFGEELPPPPPSLPPRVSRSSLVSINEMRSLTPVSGPRDSATTLAPPPMAITQARKASASRTMLFGVGAALVVAIGATVVVSRVARTTAHPDTAPPPPVTIERVVTVEKTSAPPPVTATAAATITEKTTTKTFAKPVLTAKSAAAAKPTATPSAAPSATATAAPTTPAQDVYDRRY